MEQVEVWSTPLIALKVEECSDLEATLIQLNSRVKEALIIIRRILKCYNEMDSNNNGNEVKRSKRCLLLIYLREHLNLYISYMILSKVETE